MIFAKNTVNQIIDTFKQSTRRNHILAGMHVKRDSKFE